jgi:hypothetical protein
MELEAKSYTQNTFLNHVFSTTDESKAEMLNVIQYGLMAVIPIVALNKSIQKFIPEADVEKSSIELLAEVFMQIVLMFIGIIIVHRLITYVPTYSGYKYESFNLTTVILAFLMIVLSLQTKLGLKVNILTDRLYELWNGPSDTKKTGMKKSVRQGISAAHIPSQADHLTDGGSSSVFPPAPAISQSAGGGQGFDYMMKVSGIGQPSAPAGVMDDFGPAPANSMIGGGASFW